jgi:adenosine deaminase
MSVENFIRAMPKVDLYVLLEGALQKDLILQIADQNDTATNYKKLKEYQDWVNLLKKPDFNRIDDIARETSTWIRHPDDIARAVYDLAVQYSKQNVKYAEITVNAAHYTDLNLGFGELMEALNDGANRAERAWGVKLNWILSIPRNNPRKSDDVARWVTSATAQKGNVVGMSVVGREDVQPIAQFKKAFNTVEKKGMARIAPVYSYPNSDSFQGVIDSVNPTRLVDAWGLIDDPQAIEYVVENQIPVLLTPIREVRLGRISSVAEYPLPELLDRGIKVIIASGMPALFETTLNDEYVAAVTQAGVTLAEIQQIVRNGFEAALVPNNEKQAMLTEFDQACAALREEHLTETE